MTTLRVKVTHVEVKVKVSQVSHDIEHFQSVYFPSLWSHTLSLNTNRNVTRRRIQ